MPFDGRDESVERERRVGEVLGAYFEALEAGSAEDPRALLDRHPDLGDELRAFFADHAALDRLAAPLRPVALASRADETAPTEDAGATMTVGLDAEATTANGDPHDAPRPGLRVRYFGDFELIEEIARGGMGVVYRARQLSLNRLVALKMLLAGEEASTDELKRFRAEAEAAANLDHPHIVPIYEVGEALGRSYFAMKLIEGGSLAAHLGEVAADPRRAANLVATVARAVHHAHQRGVLHRDLKPSNILLDERDEPHVTDFGLAKRVESDSELTQSGALLGTPSYMAPEQAIGRKGTITTATDVYGLGGVLYAILAGKPPFRGDSVLETLEQVREKAPEPPGVLGGRPDRDLETICLKCLEKEPERRYASAEALAEDLERWLRGEPIMARPAGRPERAWRWCRRNPVVAGLAATVAALLIGVLTSLIVSNVLIRREQRRTAANLEFARQAVRKYLTTVSENRLLNEAGLQPLRKELLEAALPFYQALARQADDTHASRTELAEAYMDLARIERLTGRLPESLEAIRSAVKIARGLVSARRGDGPAQTLLADCLRGEGNLLLDTGQGKEAIGPLKESLALHRRLAADGLETPEHREGLASALFLYGSVLQTTGDVSGAEDACREAVERFEGMIRQGSDSSSVKDKLAQTLHVLGQLRFDVGDQAGAERYFQRAIDVLTPLAAAYPGQELFAQQLGQLHNRIGHVRFGVGRIADAERSYRRALDSYSRASDANPSVPALRVGVAASWGNIANAQKDGGDRKAAARTYQKATEVFEALVKAHPSDANFRTLLVSHLFNMGRFLSDDNDPEATRAMYRRAVAEAERLTAIDPENLRSQGLLIRARNGLAGQLEEAGQREQALRLRRESVRLATRLSEAHPEVLDLRFCVVVENGALADLLLESGDLPAARIAADRAVAAAEQLVGREPQSVNYRAFLGSNCTTVGDIVHRSGAPEAARGHHDRAIRVLEEARKAQPMNPMTRANLRAAYAGRALDLHDLGRHTEAILDWERAIRFAEPSRLPAVRQNLALDLALSGDHRRAVAEAEALLVNGEPAPRVKAIGLAATFVAASAAAGRDAHLAEAERRALSERHATTAIRLLSALQKSGHFRNVPASIGVLKSDKSLDSLRGRDDFRAILKALR